jgi:hypothetical protein
MKRKAGMQWYMPAWEDRQRSLKSPGIRVDVPSFAVTITRQQTSDRLNAVFSGPDSDNICEFRYKDLTVTDHTGLGFFLDSS